MIFSRIYNYGILDEHTIFLDGISYKCTIGKHCVWIPDLEIKISWAFNGKIESYRDWEKGRNAKEIMNQSFGNGFWDEESLISIQNEYNIFGLLSKYKMSPPVDGYIYIKNIQSSFCRYRHNDPIGIIGYKIRDANKLPKGRWSFDEFLEKFIDTGIISASLGAAGDLKKDNNVVNGFLIDVRRTIWDMMKLNGYIAYTTNIDSIINEEDDKVKSKVLQYGQFPFKERKKAYQTYWFKDHYEDGTRQTLYRFDKMKIDKDLAGKTVLDLGCQIGSMCTEAYMRGARWITGIDNQNEYVDCARDLARVNGHQINYQCIDLMNIDKTLHYISAYYDNDVIDIVFMLSLYKHIGAQCWNILQHANFKTAYIESNNCPDKWDSKQAKEIEIALHERFKKSKIERICITEDRSPRCVWRITNV